MIISAIYRRFSFLIILVTSTTFHTQAQTTLHLELLGETVVAYNKMVQDSPVGGLSGLTYDRANNIFYVISDDRSEYTPARFYSFRLNLSDIDSLTPGAVQWVNKVYLKDANDKPYGEDLVDPEGIAQGPDSVIYISSEGDPRISAAPFINGYNRREG